MPDASMQGKQEAAELLQGQRHAGVNRKCCTFRKNTDVALLLHFCYTRMTPKIPFRILYWALHHLCIQLLGDPCTGLCIRLLGFTVQVNIIVAGINRCIECCFENMLCIEL